MTFTHGHTSSHYYSNELNSLCPTFHTNTKIFKDPVITAAMVDRLTQLSYVIDMNGKSYRYLEQKLLKESKLTRYQLTNFTCNIDLGLVC